MTARDRARVERAIKGISAEVEETEVGTIIVRREFALPADASLANFKRRIAEALKACAVEFEVTRSYEHWPVFNSHAVELRVKPSLYDAAAAAAWED